MSINSSKLTVTKANQLIQRASWAAFGLAIFLIFAKTFAWIITGSVVVLTTFVDSLMDAFSTGLNLIAVRYAILPADDDHRFGHGKAENLAALTQATFVAGSAFFLMIQAADRLMHPRPLVSLDMGLAIMFFSMFFTGILVLYQRYVIKKTNSGVVKAASLNFTMDLVTNLSVIFALGLSYLGLEWVDPLFAIIIGCLILYNAYQIGIDAIHHLMDRELSDEIKSHIFNLASGSANVLGVHAFRTRQSGQSFFIYLHLDIDENLSFKDAHLTCVAVITAIQTEYPNAEVFAHQDPINKANYTLEKSMLGENA